MNKQLMYGVIIVHPLLQLLADGGDSGETGSAAGSDAGENEQAAAAAEPSREETFRNLIRGEYKDLYDKEVQTILHRRMKPLSEKAAAFDKSSAMLDALAKRHGVDVSDIDALSNAVLNDKAYIRQYADEHGVSDDTASLMMEMERENSSVKKQLEAFNRERQFADIVSQSEALKQKFPNFDLMQAMQNEEFMEAIQMGKPVEKAYKYAFQDEILAAGMAHAVEETKKKVSASVAANAKRPSESGASVAASTPTVDFSTKAKRDEIASRVARGEKIRL